MTGRRPTRTRTRIRGGARPLAVLVCFLGAAFTPASARADDPGGVDGAGAGAGSAGKGANPDDGVGPLAGKVIAHLRVPTKNTPIQQASTSVWLELKPRLGPSYAHFVGVADAFAASVPSASIPSGSVASGAVASGSDARLRLREGYVGARNEKLDFRIGHQIIPWGNADVVSPTDFLTARDLTFFSSDPEANRLGVLSARTIWTPLTWLGFEIVLTPITPVTRLLLPPALLPPGVAFIPTQQPQARLENIEAAERITINYKSWDLSVLAFRGFNHVPEVALRGVRADGSLDLALVQHTYRALGLHSSLAAGGFVFRVESAYVKTENNSGNNPLIQPTHWDSVVGAERSFFDQRLRVQVQSISRYYPRSPSSTVTGVDPNTAAVLNAIGSANSILQNYIHQFRLAESLRVAYATSDDKLAAEVFVVLNVVNQSDFIFRPLVSYRPSDALKLDVGAELYGGPRGTPLGALSSFNGVFTQGTYTF
jgi:hypothetical protein